MEDNYFDVSFETADSRGSCLLVIGVPACLTSKYQLRKQFCTFGEISDVHYGRTQGQALIYFKEKTSAQKAVQNCRRMIFGTPIGITIASQIRQKQFFLDLTIERNRVESLKKPKKPLLIEERSYKEKPEKNMHSSRTEIEGLQHKELDSEEVQITSGPSPFEQFYKNPFYEHHKSEKSQTRKSLKKHKKHNKNSHKKRSGEITIPEIELKQNIKSVQKLRPNFECNQVVIDEKIGPKKVQRTQPGQITTKKIDQRRKSGKEKLKLIQEKTKKMVKSRRKSKKDFKKPLIAHFYEDGDQKEISKDLSPKPSLMKFHTCDQDPYIPFAQSRFPSNQTISYKRNEKFGDFYNFDDFSVGKFTTSNEILETNQATYNEPYQFFGAAFRQKPTDSTKPADPRKRLQKDQAILSLDLPPFSKSFKSERNIPNDRDLPLIPLMPDDCPFSPSSDGSDRNIIKFQDDVVSINKSIKKLNELFTKQKVTDKTTLSYPSVQFEEKLKLEQKTHVLSETAQNILNKRSRIDIDFERVEYNIKWHKISDEKRFFKTAK